MGRKYAIRNQKAVHFVTFTVVEWIDVFTRPSYKQVILDSLQFCREKKGLNVYGYVIMTNHIHLLVSSKKDDLSSIIRDFRAYTAKVILKMIDSPKESRRYWMLRVFGYYGQKNKRNSKYQFWLQDSHPIEIQDEEMLYQKLDYIHNNPLKEGFVERQKDYPYSSASYFTNQPSSLLLPLDWGIT